MRQNARLPDSFFVGVEYGSRDCVFRTVLKEDEVGGTIPSLPVLRNDGVM